MKFADLPLHENILKAIAEKGYTEPTPIQAGAIPVALQGRDVIGCAQTGTGKTAAFSIPTLDNLYKKKLQGNTKKGIKALIVTPTRELAIQIDEQFSAYGKHTGLRHAVIFGGVKQFHQVKKIKAGLDILIATPGRLLDLAGQGIVKLSSIEIFVLDEADRMLDMGFIHDIKKILKLIPVRRQSLFFSATMPDSITKLASTMLHKPKRIEVAAVSSAAETVTQKLYTTSKKDKRELLLQLLHGMDGESALVFTRTKHGANKLTKFINNAGFSAEAIHGNKTQNARQKALKNFKNKTTKVLVATDIAARGIDIAELPYVVNFEVPNVPETYVHRIGRTGRAQNVGTALTLVDESEQKFIQDIHRLIDKKIPVDESHLFHVPLRFQVRKTPRTRSGRRAGR